jgi:hypothetical protein
MFNHSQKFFVIFLSLCILPSMYAMEENKRERTKSAAYPSVNTRKVAFDNKVTVYFPVNDTKKFNDIKINGLQFHLASFFLNPPANSTNLIYYIVNPDEYDVYDAKYRMTGDWESYDTTRLPLTQYLANKQWKHNFGNYAEVLISIPDGKIPPEKLKFKEKLITRRDALKLSIQNKN